MNKPVIADNKPISVELEQNKEYYFCSCDGSHKQFSTQQIGQEGPGIKTNLSDMPTPGNTPEEPM